MRISQLVAALEAYRAAHGDIEVAVTGCEPDDTPFGVHTAPWVRAEEPGRPVVVYIDVTADAGSVGE